MRRLPILLTLLLPAAASAQSLSYWQDVNVTSVNAETQRTEAIWFANRADALKKGFRESENYVDLNGTWDFKYFDDYHEMERYRVPTGTGSRCRGTGRCRDSGCRSM